MKDPFKGAINNVYRHIEVLRREARFWEQRIEQLMTGARPPVADARIIERNARILRIVQDFDNQQRTPLRYLRALGRLF